MSDEQDSWLKSTFGLDVDGAAKRIEDEARAAAQRVADEARAAATAVANTVTQVAQGVQGAVEQVIDEAVGVATGVAKKVAGAAGVGGAGGGSPKTSAPAGGGTGSFPLSGSVGRGGNNAANDVKAVQAALGISTDGKCGKQTIGAIEAFQRSIGQAKPDGRVDAGGATERALAGGAKPAPVPATGPGEDDAGGLLDRALKGAKALAGGLAGLGDQIELGDKGDSTTDNAALNDQIRAELSSQIQAQTASRGGLIGELNDLDDFRKTDPDPVPEFKASFAGADPATLANDIKEKEFAIGQMERQRTNICKQARADARLASEAAESDMTAALLGGPGVGLVSGAVMAMATMSGGSLALLGAMCASIIAQHEIYRKYRDTIRSIVNKAHTDLTIINTAIAVERKKLDAMTAALVKLTYPVKF